MSAEFEPHKLYVIEGYTLNLIKRIEQRLYEHDFKRINADEARDFANALNAQVNLNHQWELPDEERTANHDLQPVQARDENLGVSGRREGAE
jgi:hypothetical protein